MYQTIPPSPLPKKKEKRKEIAGLYHYQTVVFASCQLEATTTTTTICDYSITIYDKMCRFSLHF